MKKPHGLQRCLDCEPVDEPGHVFIGLFRYTGRQRLWAKQGFCESDQTTLRATTSPYRRLLVAWPRAPILTILLALRPTNRR